MRSPFKLTCIDGISKERASEDSTENAAIDDSFLENSTEFMDKTRQKNPGGDICRAGHVGVQPTYKKSLTFSVHPCPSCAVRTVKTTNGLEMSEKKLIASKEEKGPGYISDLPQMEGGNPPAKKFRRGLMMMLIPLVLFIVAGAGGFLVYSGTIKLPFLAHKKTQQAALPQMQFIKMPELVANLDAGADADSYAKMQAELEVTDPISAAAVTTQMPAIIDLFQSYLRTMQPGDLQGAEGLYRLREALLARANVIVAPSSVQDVLFIELIVQ